MSFYLYLIVYLRSTGFSLNMGTVKFYLAFSAVLLILLLLFPSPSIEASTPPDCPVHSDPHPDARELVEQSISAMGRIKTLKGRLVTWERYFNSSTGDYGDVDFNLRESPKEVRILAHKPEGDAGTRIFYKEGSNKNQASVRKPMALIDTLGISLDPEGKKLINQSHHSILTLGFKLTHNVLKKALKDHGEKFKDYVTYMGMGKRWGRNCHEIELNFKDWAWTTYTMEKTETLLDLERRINLSAYLIAEKNNLLVYETVKAGKVLKVPNAFAKTTTLYIDAQNLLPIGQIMYDENGVFEKYEYKNLVVN